MCVCVWCVCMCVCLCGVVCLCRVGEGCYVEKQEVFDLQVARRVSLVCYFLNIGNALKKAHKKPTTQIYNVFLLKICASYPHPLPLPKPVAASQYTKTTTRAHARRHTHTHIHTHTHTYTHIHTTTTHDKSLDHQRAECPRG